LAVVFGSASCQALPPPARADARMGVVRAGSPEEARRVAVALDDLLPAVIAEVPDSRARALEVWVQEEPNLYVFPGSSAYREADGFFSDRLSRIHLRSKSDDVERTLAHELVHASLGSSWHALPGTLEEGLCDVIAVRLCPESAPRLRAGRLLAAALAIGGLDLEIRIDLEVGPEAGVSELSFVQRLVPAGDAAVELDPCEVFRTRAGISSTFVSRARKRALYGLAFLVTERIVARHGIEGFHRLAESLGECRGSEEAVDLLLTAAELTPDREDWRQALAEALGPAEMAELSRLQPGISARIPTTGSGPETRGGVPAP